jgi:hypothetical protein
VVLLYGQAAQLQELMTFFQLAEGGRTSAAAQRKASAARVQQRPGAPAKARKAAGLIAAVAPVPGSEHAFERF